MVLNAEMRKGFVKVAQLSVSSHIIVTDLKAFIKHKLRDLEADGVFHLRSQLWNCLKQWVSLHADLKLLEG